MAFKSKPKTFLILLMLSFVLFLGFAVSVTNVNADMPWPDYYRQNRYHDNVYYQIEFDTGKYPVHTYYGRMPALFRKKGFLYPIYGKRLARETNGTLGKPRYWHGRKYVQAYTGEFDKTDKDGDGDYPPSNQRINGKRIFITDVYVRSRDLGKLVKGPQSVQDRSNEQDYRLFKKYNIYALIKTGHYHHYKLSHRKVNRKHRQLNHRRKNRVSKRRPVGYRKR